MRVLRCALWRWRAMRLTAPNGVGVRLRPIIGGTTDGARRCKPFALQSCLVIQCARIPRKRCGGKVPAASGRYSARATGPLRQGVAMAQAVRGKRRYM